MRKDGTLSGELVTSIAVTNRTKAMLKQIAADMDIPVYRCVRQLAEDRLQHKQGVIPGQELSVSPNTIAAVNVKLATIEAKLDSFYRYAFPKYFEQEAQQKVEDMRQTELRLERV